MANRTEEEELLLIYRKKACRDNFNPAVYRFSPQDYCRGNHMSKQICMVEKIKSSIRSFLDIPIILDVYFHTYTTHTHMHTHAVCPKYK